MVGGYNYELVTRVFIRRLINNSQLVLFGDI